MEPFLLTLCYQVGVGSTLQLIQIGKKWEMLFTASVSENVHVKKALERYL